MCSSWCIGGVRRRKRKRHGWDGTQADMIMPSLLYYLSPWRPRALCAVCVRSPRRSCLCFWTAAGSGVYSKIRLEELQRCQGCRKEEESNSYIQLKGFRRRRMSMWMKVFLRICGNPENSIYSHLSLALQCLQQKHVEWKTRLLATNFSIG